MDKEQIKNLYLNMYKAKSALNRYKLVHLVGLTLISGLVSYKVLPKSTQEEVPVTYKIDFAGDSNNGISILNEEQVEYSREPGANKYDSASEEEYIVGINSCIKSQS